MTPDDTIYIAGHTGLIGSAFVRRLNRNGHRNILLRRRRKLDLTDGVAVDRFFRKKQPRYVVLTAGRVGGIVENNTYPGDFITTNLSIQINVMTAARRHDVKRLLFLGSSCMYPRECPQPMAETALLTGHPEPTSMAYAMAKLAGVEMCLSFNRQDGGKRFIPIIPNSAFGPGDNFDPEKGHVLSALIRRFHEAKRDGIDQVTLWGTGTPRRELIHADDIATAGLLLLGLDEDRLPEMPVNIGVGTDWAIKELAELTARIVGYQGSLAWDTSRPDGAPRKLLDSGRINALGWTPSISLEEGIRETYNWYKEQAAS